MGDPSQSPPYFGDLLARARQSWIREMAARLANDGFANYRASDALAVRILRPKPMPFAHFTATLGSTRQAARKVIDGLVQRDFARVLVDDDDARRRVVTLTDTGRRYAERIVAAIQQLNDEMTKKVEPAALLATREVLTFVHDTFGTSSPLP